MKGRKAEEQVAMLVRSSDNKRSNPQRSSSLDRSDSQEKERGLGYGVLVILSSKDCEEKSAERNVLSKNEMSYSVK